MQYLSCSNIQNHDFIVDIIDIAFSTNNEEHRVVLLI